MTCISTTKKDDRFARRVKRLLCRQLAELEEIHRARSGKRRRRTPRMSTAEKSSSAP
jgi:hypothetical protein